MYHLNVFIYKVFLLTRYFCFGLILQNIFWNNFLFFKFWITNFRKSRSIVKWLIQRHLSMWQQKQCRSIFSSSTDELHCVWNTILCPQHQISVKTSVQMPYRLKYQFVQRSTQRLPVAPQKEAPVWGRQAMMHVCTPAYPPVALQRVFNVYFLLACERETN